MFDKILDLFMQFRFSPLWYIFLIGLITFITLQLAKTKEKSTAEYERMNRILLFAISLPIVMITALFMVFFFWFGFAGNIANDSNLLIMFSLGLFLIFFPIIYKIYKRK